jgi:hypothetical protein
VLLMPAIHITHTKSIYIVSAAVQADAHALMLAHESAKAVNLLDVVHSMVRYSSYSAQM